jgi:CubicO group peptidase (beta-lactamase class C family)
MRRRQFTSLMGATALAPFTAFAQEDKLGQVADGIVASGANIHSLLVARGGKIVFERYFTGADEIQSRKVGKVAFNADTLHDMKSVSKSVASLAIGVAVDRGLIKSVDEPIVSFFPELADLHSPERDRLTLRHALTMTMGLRWIEATPATGDEDNDEARMHRAADPCRYVLSLPVTGPPGQEFFYNTGALTLLSVLMRKATGRPLDEFAKEVLFEPLGITDWEWKRYKGDSDAGGGLRLKPCDMMKIGQLMLAGGQWNGQQIVSKAWIDASTAPQIAVPSTATRNPSGINAYGYLWWLGRTPLADGREVRWIGALGRGGQSFRIVPELDLVVVVTAGYYQDYSPEAFQLQANVFKDVVRAIPPPG